MEKKKEKKRLVMSEPLLLAMSLMDDDNDKIALIRALVAYGKGDAVATDEMYSKVKTAFEYLTNPKREDYIYDDLEQFN